MLSEVCALAVTPVGIPGADPPVFPPPELDESPELSSPQAVIENAINAARAIIPKILKMFFIKTPFL